MERRKGPLPSPPADFLCAFVARGNEYRSVVELETYDKELSWSKGDKPRKTSLNRDSTVLLSNQPIYLKVLSLTLNLQEI